ncbi:Protein of unknown function [Bacillus wiedmannii]|nr:Protein of unknown function [Bacillus wiedmannii]
MMQDKDVASTVGLGLGLGLMQR